MQKKTLIFSLVSCMFYLGCSGRTPNPVLCYSLGDDALSCEELKIEMADIKRDIEIKGTRITERNARNLWLSVGSPFEQDILKGEEIEIQALKNRHNSLLMIAYNKGCVVGGLFPKFKNELLFLCKYCGPSKSNEWHVVNGDSVCGVCYKKRHTAR